VWGSRVLPGLRETFYRVLAILYRYAVEVTVLDYPDRIERRSIDLIAKLRDGRSVLLKVAEDASDLPRSEVAELRGLGATLGMPAGIIALRVGGLEIPAHVMYERMGVPVISPETLEEYMRTSEGVYAYQARDTLRVRLNTGAMREARERLGLSLGDLAARLGVSRKMVYEYERGEADPTIEKAERIARLLGDEVIGSIDPFEKPPQSAPSPPPFDERGEEAIARELAVKGYSVFHAKKTAADLAASSAGGERIIIAYKHRRESLSRLLDRVDNLIRMSRASNSRPVAVVSSREEERELEGEEELIILRLARLERGRILAGILNPECGEEAPDNG
jgi:putative transcriptional regulator